MMEEIKLNNLPKDILQKIFSYLEIEDLLNSTLICKKFNEIIGKSDLMKNVILCWKDESYSEKILTKSSRKYYNFKIQAVIPELWYIENILKNLKSLACIEISNCGMKSSTIGYILHFVKDNLEELSCCAVNFSLDMIAVPLKFTKLGSIEFKYCYGCSLVTDFFKNSSTVHTFRFDKECDYPLITEEVRKFAELLASLDGLKDLKVKYDLSQEIFRDGYFVNAAKCKLQRLALDMGPGDQLDDLEVFVPDGSDRPEYPTASYQHYQNFSRFLNNQRGILQALELTDFTFSIEFLDLILSIGELKKLTMHMPNFQGLRKSFIQNRSIEELCVSKIGFIDESFEEGLDEVMRCCPAIKSLIFEYFEPTPNICASVLNNLENLTCLALQVYDMEPFVFPTVTLMQIYCSSYNDNFLDLLRINQQLKHIKLSSIDKKYYPKVVKKLAQLGIEDKIEYE